ncbi:MAG TPA: hypothetical protein VNZ44_12095 [Pyrinomonadaceae bacterium]|nr:hypothetical protein [Pyrinomonadaceae bacterium]
MRVVIHGTAMFTHRGEFTVVGRVELRDGVIYKDGQILGYKTLPAGALDDVEVTFIPKAMCSCGGTRV